jgi:hypothetical protein
MSRREIVLLVSRAVAILTIITALNDLLADLAFWGRLLTRQMIFHGTDAAVHIAEIQWAGVILSAVRILGLLFIAGLFWTCGPKIEGFLLLAGAQGQSDTPQ